MTHNTAQYRATTVHLFIYPKFYSIYFVWFFKANYGKIIRFLKVSVLNAMPTALVWLEVVTGGCTESTNHSECSPGSSGHFVPSHVMKTQNFEYYQKSVFCHTLRTHMGMKEWFARVAQAGA